MKVSNDLTQKDQIIIIGLGMCILLEGVFIQLLFQDSLLTLGLMVASGLSLLAALMLLVFRRLQGLMVKEANRIEAVVSINEILKPAFPLPAFGGSALEADAALELITLVYRTKPRVIMELGSGLSTILVGHVLKNLGQGKIISVDQSDFWAKKTQENVTLHGIEDFASVHFAPLKTISLQGDVTSNWYDLSHIALDTTIDLLIVDGPTAWNNPNARYPSLPFFWSNLSIGATIFVDDSNRFGENRMINQWLTLYSGKLRLEWNDTHKGIALLSIISET